MLKRLEKNQYINGILSGDRIVLGRAITLIESTLEQDINLGEEIIETILPYSGKSLRIGITGVPGVGKSTFIETLGENIITEGHKLAVLAIDPTSKSTKGSILGDKTRMETLSKNPKAFIRPSPAGNWLGGTGHKTRECVLLCEAAGFDTIFIETVGVGQSETMVKEMVDFFLLLMLAGAGDELQGIKKGIMEMANMVVITKADSQNEQNSQLAKQEYEAALHFMKFQENGYLPKVLTCSALKNTGIYEIWKEIQNFVGITKANTFFENTRNTQQLDWLHAIIQHHIVREFYENPTNKAAIEEQKIGILASKISVIKAARSILKN